MTISRNPAGRGIAHPTICLTAQDLMRRHLREEGLCIADLIPVFGQTQNSTYRHFNRSGAPMRPELVEAFIRRLRLDDFDALELRLHAACDHGWDLHALKGRVI